MFEKVNTFPTFEKYAKYLPCTYRLQNEIMCVPKLMYLRIWKSIICTCTYQTAVK